MLTAAEAKKGRKLKELEVDLCYPQNEDLRREREHSMRDIRELLNISRGLDFEEKRRYLADATIFPEGEALFTSEQLNLLAGLPDEELLHQLTRFETLLKSVVKNGG